VGVMWCAVVGGDPQTPLLHCARPGRCARLGLLRRAYELGCRSRGRPWTPLLRGARPGRCTWLSSSRGRAVLCRGRGSPFPSPLRSAWP
jgi:hypothetical protein